MRIPEWNLKRPTLPMSLGAAAGGLAIAIGATGALLSPGDSRADTEKAQSAGLAVTTTAVAHSMLPLRVPASGTVAAVDEIILGSEVAGLAVAELLADEGDQVTKGQILARLNRDILDAQLAQTIAQIASARASAAEAAANERRAVELGARGFVSKQMIDQRRATALSSQAQVSLMEAQRDELEARLKQTVITAPADGVIATRGVSQGQVVGAGTELFRIIRDGKLEWNAELPDHQLAQLSEGQKATITVGAASVDGSIRLISEKIDARSRNGVVHVALPADTRLRAGMFARGEIIGGEIRAMTLPEAAVITKDGESYVFTITGQGRAQLTKVETGVRRAKLVEIRRGVTIGARVVLDGAGLLSEGDQVRVTGHVPNAEAAKSA